MTGSALVFTDLVDSTALVEQLGDARAAALLGDHDRRSRDLAARYRGREVDHTDGFFLVFEVVIDATDFALAYQQSMAELALAARVGIHVGVVSVHANAADDVARGAKPLEVDGLAKPIAARVMSHARGGQILLTLAARDALGDALPAGAAVQSLGHYRIKGVAEPLELFELGVRGSSAFAPPPDTEKVYRVVRAGDLWRPVRVIRHNLPAESDAFFGRTAEMRALALSLDAGARLLTVAGPGGTGKTRFVCRFGWTWLGDWPGGVYFCDLSDARSLDGVMRAVSVALDVPLGSTDPSVQLGHAIAARGRCLIIADNFEQVVGHAAATLGLWVKRAADAAFVITSRESLHLAGEEVFLLEPLPLDNEAIELFAARARAQRPEFTLTPAHREDVQRIVKLLDGLPLAIELAAARVRVLSPAQIVERMRDRFSLLAGARGATARQATLRTAIDWSWDLLAAWEQAALAQCAVFEGGFTLELAQQLLDLSPWPEAPQTMDVVQALVDKSLLRSWIPGSESRYELDEPYFGMYVSIKEYARERLRAGGSAAERVVEERHGRCFAAFGADDAIEALYVHGGVRRRRALARELDNIVAACHRAVARGDAQVAVATCNAALEALHLGGPFSLAAALGAEVLGLPGLDATHRARALLIRAYAARRGALHVDEAPAWLEESLAIAIQCRDRRLEAFVRILLGGMLRHEGRFQEAQTHHEAALAALRETANRRGEGAVLLGLGILCHEQGRVEEGRVHFDQALAVQREIGNRLGEADVLGCIGAHLAGQGRLAEARAHYEASLAIDREVGNRVGEGESLSNLGAMYIELGDHDAARSNLERALAIHREVGYRRFEGYVLASLGLMHLEQGQWNDARACLEQSIAIAREIGDRFGEGDGLKDLGELFLAQGLDDAARAAFRAAEEALRQVGAKQALAFVLRGRGELERRAGDIGAARATLAEARELATLMRAGPGSQLGRAIETLASALS